MNLSCIDEFSRRVLKIYTLVNIFQVILMGGSAGAIGTESNCDAFAARLHQFNPGSYKSIHKTL